MATLQIAISHVIQIIAKSSNPILFLLTNRFSWISGWTNRRTRHWLKVRPIRQILYHRRIYCSQIFARSCSDVRDRFELHTWFRIGWCPAIHLTILVEIGELFGLKKIDKRNPKTLKEGLPVYTSRKYFLARYFRATRDSLKAPESPETAQIDRKRVSDDWSISK